MKPADIIRSDTPGDMLAGLLGRLHDKGPVDSEDLETLAYLKRFHPAVFSLEENRLMYLLGLFHKTTDPNDILSFSYSAFQNAIREETGQRFTPVQASIRSNILKSRYFSFSAPTSSGKSYLLRDLIKNQVDDIVIVVPTRALIAEYLLAVRDIVSDQKDVLVLQFIDDINKQNTSRRVFIVTPERGTELFKDPGRFGIALFLFDEAQISDESTRGISFDSFIRRVDRAYPEAKKVFAHPFVANPDAQLSKHGFEVDANSVAYSQSTVGKLFVYHDVDRRTFECFSPFIPDGHLKRNRYELDSDIVASSIRDGGSVLIYISKASIYEGSFRQKFGDYIELCQPVEDPRAIDIVDQIQEHIGADNDQSDLVELMRHGVVIHHGSVPLSVRFQIEEFTRLGFARICFATSTLVHGVNMPFDIVWVDNLRFFGTEEDKILGLKNLIGRAGRSTAQVDCFDYGFVIVEKMTDFIKRLNSSSNLSPTSVLDAPSTDISPDQTEFVEAVKNESMVDEYNMPRTRLERLSSPECHRYIEISLENLFGDEGLITGNAYRDLPDGQRNQIKDSLKNIYSISLGRELKPGEQVVLSTSITTLLWHIQGKAFREVIALRYRFLTQQSKQDQLAREHRLGNITDEKYREEMDSLTIQYSAIPYQLPNSTLRGRLPSRFKYDHVSALNFDLLVYDTYDYLDKVISFSLSDVFIAAYGEYYSQYGDERAGAMVNYVRYGTNDETEIWLLRYGFTFEDIEDVGPYVRSVDEDRIIFTDSIRELIGEPVMALVERYM